MMAFSPLSASGGHLYIQEMLIKLDKKLQVQNTISQTKTVSGVDIGPLSSHLKFYPFQ